MKKILFTILISTALILPSVSEASAEAVIQYMRDGASLSFANELLRQTDRPINYDEYLELTQLVLNAGGVKPRIQPFAFLGQEVKATNNDPLTFYIDTELEKNAIAKAGTFVYGWDAVPPGFVGGKTPPPLPDSMALPVPGAVVTQWYGCQGSIRYSTECTKTPPSWLHNGIDFDASGTGEPIVAAASGTVLAIGVDPGCGYGNWVVIQHPDIQRYTGYAHLSKVAVLKGDSVKQGQEIGVIGSTGFVFGEHLHFMLFASQPSIANNCIVGKAIDPFGYLKE